MYKIIILTKFRIQNRCEEGLIEKGFDIGISTPLSTGFRTSRKGLCHGSQAYIKVMRVFGIKQVKYLGSWAKFVPGTSSLDVLAACPMMSQWRLWTLPLLLVVWDVLLDIMTMITK